MLVSELCKKLHERIIRELLDFLLMIELKNQSMSGYTALSHIHNKYDYLVSSGTVYSLLYSLEREELIQGSMNGKKRVFELTSKGETLIDTILAADEGLLGLVKNLILSL